MAVFERPSGPGVAERVQAEPGSPEEKELEQLASKGVDGWRKVGDDPKPKQVRKATRKAKADGE